MSRWFLACSFLVAAGSVASAAPPVVVRIEGGREVPTTVEEARAKGLTIVDLSDEWTPVLFASQLDSASGQPVQARYRTILVGMAKDEVDGDGVPLRPGEHNYLELFGVMPAISVLHARFQISMAPDEPCSKIDYEKLRSVKSLSSPTSKKPLPAAEAAVFAEVEARLACEKMWPPKMKHQKGVLDDAMRDALKRFQFRNMIYDRQALLSETMAALARPPVENDHRALLRALTERVVSAASILEDGSGDNGRNLVDEFTQAAAKQLGWDTLDGAKAFFARHKKEDFATLQVALTLPALPEYYAPHMDLDVEIDRGDVFYDPPWDENGKAVNQSRKVFPSITVRVKYNGKSIRLIKWRTTIGGWRSDFAPNGYEYFRYKGSDVGPRVWRNVVAGPVWIAPDSTPLRSLVKSKYVNGSEDWVVNYDEIGPGYLSAYGVVAAYNVVPGKDGKPDWDNGVRVHGSSEIYSIRNPEAYSHGCHRLMNHLAERLFSFVISHRNKAVEGEKSLNFSRQFLYKERVFELRLPTRGFWYRLEPPVPVNVLEGNIQSKLKKPPRTYIQKPGVVYPPGPIPLPPDLPESRAGGGE